MPTIKKGTGFNVGKDFARAWTDLEVTVAAEEYARPNHVIAYVKGNPESTLGFLRRDRVRIHVRAQDIIY